MLSGVFSVWICIGLVGLDCWWVVWFWFSDGLVFWALIVECCFVLLLFGVGLCWFC